MGFGHGLDDLALLPVNITLRARIGDYAGFGFRIGVLYVVGIVAFLLARGGRLSPAAAAGLKLAGLVTLLWFFTFQEPRYLLPALCLVAVAGGVGLDAILPRRRGAAALLWLVPLGRPRPHPVERGAAAAVALRLRARRACRSPGSRRRSPRSRWSPALRRAMGPGDRLLPIHEPRGFFYRGMDYLPATPPEVMQVIHEAPSPEALADRLRALGVTHVLVNASNVGRYRTWYVEGYGPQDDERALARLEAFLARHTTPVIEDRGVIVRRVNPATAAGR